eukprot:6182205-Pleurochrysis_carterae.AAC.1
MSSCRAEKKELSSLTCRASIRNSCKAKELSSLTCRASIRNSCKAKFHQLASRRRGPSLTTRHRAPLLAAWRLAQSNPLTARRRAPYFAAWRLALSIPLTTRRRMPSFTARRLALSTFRSPAPCALQPPLAARRLALSRLCAPGALRCPLQQPAASHHPAPCAVPLSPPAPCAVPSQRPAPCAVPSHPRRRPELSPHTACLFTLTDILATWRLALSTPATQAPRVAACAVRCPHLRRAL